MLFASLKGEDICTLSIYILRRTDDSSRQLAHKILGAGKEADIWTSEAERHSKSLRVTAYYVCTPLTRSLDDCKGRRIGIYHQQSLLCMNRISETCQVLYDSIFIDTRNKHTCHISGSKFSGKRTVRSRTVLTWNESEFHTIELCIGLHHLDDLWQKSFRDKNAGLLLCRSHSHHHGLSCSRRTVVHRSIGTVHAGEFCDHRLILKYIAESSLRDFRLIWSVCREEF